MKCNIIRDLIPLYLDDVCSEETKELVKEHLNTCEECSRVSEQMKETLFENEKEREMYLDEKKLLEEGKKVIIKKEKERLGFWARAVDTVINLIFVLCGISGIWELSQKMGIWDVLTYGLVYNLAIGFFGMLFVSDLLYFLFTVKGKPASVIRPLTGISIGMKAGVIVMFLIVSCVMGWVEFIGPMMGDFPGF